MGETNARRVAEGPYTVEDIDRVIAKFSDKARTTTADELLRDPLYYRLSHFLHGLRSVAPIARLPGRHWKEALLRLVRGYIWALVGFEAPEKYQISGGCERLFEHARGVFGL